MLKAELASSTIAISTSTNDVSWSSGVKLTAKVAPAVVTAGGASVTTTSVAGAKPAGAVSWTVTSTTTGQTVPCTSETTTLESNGDASCKIAADQLSPAASPYVATVSYAGDSTFDASTQTLTVPVSKTDTGTRLTLTPPDQPGLPTLLTAMVSGVEPSTAGDPTGTVNFFVSGPAGPVPCDGGTNSLTLSSGTATCQLDLPPPVQGRHHRHYMVETSYSGDANFNPNVHNGWWRQSQTEQGSFVITNTTTAPPAPAVSPDTTSTAPTVQPATTSTTTTTTTTDPPTTPSSSGEMAAPAGYSAGDMVLDDQFANLDNWNTYYGPGTRWNNVGNLPSPYSGGNQPNSNDMAFYSPTQDVLMSGGGVSLEATPSSQFSSQGYSWESGVLTSKNPLPSGGWYVQVEAQMPDTSAGFWPAIWALPSSSAQELDGFEGGWPGVDPNEQGHSDTFAPSGQIQQVWSTPGGVDMSAGYNTYGFQYIPGTGMRFYLNGTQVYSSSANLSTEDYYLFLQLQVASAQTSGWHTTGGTTPGSMQIAEVQVYS